VDVRKQKDITERLKISHLNWSVYTRKQISHKQQLRNCAKFCMSAHSFPRNGKYLQDKKILPSIVFLPVKRTDLEKQARKLFPQTAGYRLYVLNSSFLFRIACWSICFPISHFICQGPETLLAGGPNRQLRQVVRTRHL
jgi:hypothetical protein